MSDELRSQVSAFLEQFKFIAEKGWSFIDRTKNLQFLTEIGLSIPQAKKIILGLSVIDYSSGPEADKGRHGYNIWTFNIQLDGQEIYIKLSDDFRGLQAKCVSFHKAEHPMKKPFLENDSHEK